MSWDPPLHTPGFEPSARRQKYASEFYKKRETQKKRKVQETAPQLQPNLMSHRILD
jgi:hypothetical protein